MVVDEVEVERVVADVMEVACDDDWRGIIAELLRDVVRISPVALLRLEVFLDLPRDPRITNLRLSRLR